MERQQRAKKLHKTSSATKKKNPEKKESGRGEIEHYRGLVRKLQKQVKQLEKQLSYYSKREHFFPETEDDHIGAATPIEDDTPSPPKIRCEECYRGHYDEFEFAGKVIGTCNICQNRRRLKEREKDGRD